jgi:aminopeptidase N
VLKQLGAYVGIEAFLAGLRDYFQRHAYGNTTLADLLGALERSSGRDLGEWSKLWLETAGINTLRPEFELAADGSYASFDVVQSAPDEVATSNVLRPHRLAIGLYERQDGRLVRTRRVELDVAGARTPVAELVGVQRPDLLLVNDDDLTYCKLRLDEHSIASLRAGAIAELDDSLPRALLWSAAWDMTRDGELATRDYVALVLAGIDKETDIGVLQSLTGHVRRALEIYADPAWAPQGYAALAEKSMSSLLAAEPGSDHQLAWAHALLGSMSSSSPEQLAFARGLLDGSAEVPGLAIDEDLRWSIVAALVAHGTLGAGAIDAELERDPSAAGQRNAASARALIPTAQAKADAWRQVVESDELTNAMQRAVIGGFAHWSQGELVRPYVERYFAEIRAAWDRRSTELAQSVAIGMFPSWTSTCTAETVAAADAFLAQDDVPSALRRIVAEGRADVLRAMRAREVDAAAP